MQAVITNTCYTKTVLLLKSEYDNLSEDGCFYAIVRTEYDDKGNVIYDFMDILSAAIEIGYTYINTIVYPSSIAQNVAFKDKKESFAIPLKEFAKDEYHVYVEYNDEVHKLKNEIRIVK